MRKTMTLSVALATSFGALVFYSNAGAAEKAKAPASSKAPDPSLSESPYKSGPPAVTGGYTDTSQGGTKTSGDAPIPPPSKSGEVESLKAHQETPSQPGAPAAKAPGAGG
jgi:hypothetical protein